MIFPTCKSGYDIFFIQTLKRLPMFLWIKVRHITVYTALHILSTFLTSFHALRPLVCNAPTTLGSDGPLNILSLFGVFVLTTLPIFSPILKGIASFHPLSLSLNITYWERPSLTTLARVAPTLLFSLTAILIYFIALTTTIYWCVHSFKPLSHSLMVSWSLLCP